MGTVIAMCPQASHENQWENKTFHAWPTKRAGF